MFVIIAVDRIALWKHLWNWNYRDGLIVDSQTTLYYMLGLDSKEDPKGIIKGKTEVAVKDSTRMHGHE